jgi:hypothetical protein
MNLARVTDKVLIFNSSEDDCPSTVNGYIVDGAKRTSGGGQLFALLGSRVQLDCPDCMPCTVMGGSRSVTAEGRNVHRMVVDKVVAKCGIGYTVKGLQSVQVGG